jgi:hypothetical protein
VFSLAAKGAVVIDWLGVRFRRRFPYESYNRWSQSSDEKRRWSEALDAEDVAAVRRALEGTRAGPPGLIRIGQTWVTQGFAEEWLDWRDSHKINCEKWSFLLAVAVGIVGFVGWLLS